MATDVESMLPPTGSLKDCTNTVAHFMFSCSAYEFDQATKKAALLRARALVM